MSLTRPKNDTLHTCSSRRLIEHKLNELSGSIQHSLALKVLASPPAFSFTRLVQLCCCGCWPCVVQLQLELCTLEASRLILGITVAIGTEGFRVERRYLFSLRCLWRWIGTLVRGIFAVEWIRDDPARQHGNARALRACIWVGLDT